MRKIRFGILLFAVMTALLTAGCGLNEKSAENYVKELLDYSTGRQTSTKIFDADILDTDAVATHRCHTDKGDYLNHIG